MVKFEDIINIDFKFYDNNINKYKYIDKEEYYITGLYVEEACYIVSKIINNKHYIKITTKESHKYFKAKINKKGLYKVSERFTNLCNSIVEGYKYYERRK